MRGRMLMFVFLAVCTMRLHAAYCVPVYYPEGHYLGCGTPAADGSGIWSYDPKVPEKECHDIVNRRPDWYVTGAVLGDLQTLVKPMFDSTVTGFPTRIDHVDTSTQFGAGVVLPFTNRLAGDFGFTAGNGNVTLALHNTTPPVTTFTARAGFRIFTGTAAARVYLDDATGAVRPWISAGARGVALRSRERTGQPAAATSFATGAGVDVQLTRQFGVTLAGNHGFSTGWQFSTSIVFRPRRPWPPGPCPLWQRPPCDEWPPFPFPLPFPFPYAADVHNKALDAVLTDLQNEAAVPAPARRTKEQLLATADRSARAFIQNRDLGAGAMIGYEAVRDQKLPATIAQMPGFDRFTRGQQKYLLEIDKLTMQSDLRKFEELGHRALRELGPSQAQPVLVAASVAQGSIAYWNARGEAWEHAVADYLGNDPPAMRPKINWKEVWLADVGGAVLGAATSGKDDHLSGAIGGGIGCSVSDALTQLITN